MNTDGGTTYGEKATYSCDVGYYLTGVNPIECGEGVWDENLPSCTSKSYGL